MSPIIGVGEPIDPGADPARVGITLHTADPGRTPDIRPISWSGGLVTWAPVEVETITHMAFWDAATGGRRIYAEIRQGRDMMIVWLSRGRHRREDPALSRMHQQYRARQIARRRRRRS